MVLSIRMLTFPFTAQLEGAQDELKCSPFNKHWPHVSSHTLIDEVRLLYLFKMMYTITFSRRAFQLR